MSKLFSHLSADGHEPTVDRLGGSEALPSGVYEALIKLAYAGQSASGAHNVTLVLDVDGRELRETIYFTSRTGDTFFLNKRDPSKKESLPGFVTLNDICLCLTEKGLLEQDSEEKTVKVYNSDQRKEVPTPVPVLKDLVGKKILLGILREIVDREKKNDSGVYVPTGETRTQNTIDRVFHPQTRQTVVEARQGVTEPAFHDLWKSHNDGKDRNRSNTTKQTAGQSGVGRPGMPGAAGAVPGQPKRKLFG
jgi:hypothetical protein